MSLRGGEVLLIVIKGLYMLYKDTQNHCIPHMMMTLKGIFRGKNNLPWHCVLLTDQTKIGIPTRRLTSPILYRIYELDNQERVFF